MSRKKRKKMHPKLASLFKMTAPELETRRKSGGGVHRSGPKYKTRTEQNRRAITEQLDNS